MELDIYIIDSFTDTLFSGNPAAIVPLKKWLDEEVMQNIAIENNLSETAFFKQESDGTFFIRWFSPITEIDFCGHATLASAYVLYNELGHKGEIVFNTKKVGSLIINKDNNSRVVMDFPNQQPTLIDNIPDALISGLSIQPVEVYRNQQAYMVVYSNETDIINTQTDSELLKTLAPYDVVVTAEGDESDFVSRYFWPANGGDEDPVTGSIHTCLTPFWSERLGKSTLVARQLSKRGGTLYCSLKDSRVHIAGDATLYSKGKLFINY